MSHLVFEFVKKDGRKETVMIDPNMVNGVFDISENPRKALRDLVRIVFSWESAVIAVVLVGSAIFG